MQYCRSFTILPRVLIGAEVAEIVRGIVKASNINAIQIIATQLMSMGFPEAIAHWAAGNSTGDSIEERVTNAFNILSADS